MKSFVTPRAGGNTVELAHVPIPHIDADEILVSVKTVGVGIHDSYFLPRDAQYPYPIGIEAAGVVETVGSGVTDRRVGDRIAFVSQMQPKGGTWAEYVAVKADSQIVSVPSDMDFAQAAAVPVAGGTVLRTMHGLPAFSQGDSLFIAGGSGAIGTFAIQLAVRAGWRVAASSSKSNHEYMHNLGAELTVDYHDPRWSEQVLEWMPNGVNAAIAVPPDTATGCLSVLRPGGKVVSVSGDRAISDPDSPVEMLPFGITIDDELKQLMEHITTGEMHLEIEHEYPFADAADALAKVQTRHARGKLVLQL